MPPRYACPLQVWSVSYSPTGAELASCSYDNTLRIWDAHNGRCRTVLEGHFNYVNSAAWFGDAIASASNDGTVRLWDAGSGECRAVMYGHDDWVYSVEFSHDGDYWHAFMIFV